MKLTEPESRVKASILLYMHMGRRDGRSLRLLDLQKRSGIKCVLTGQVGNHQSNFILKVPVKHLRTHNRLGSVGVAPICIPQRVEVDPRLPFLHPLT